MSAQNGDNKNEPKKKRIQQMDQWHKTYCPYCGVGCGLDVGIKDGAVAKVRGDTDHPSTKGDVCLKPIYLPRALDTPDRIREPLVRTSDYREKLEPVSWDTVTQYIADSFTEIINTYGPDAIAFYGSGQFSTEDYYLHCTGI